jgi:hypothetical protein
MKLSERPLENDYPVFCGYWYVIDGEPKESDISGTVASLKKYLSAKQIKNCDIVGRKLFTSLKNTIKY